VLRVVDPESGRHAFLGLGFDDRGDAFDFTAALRCVCVCVFVCVLLIEAEGV
jgi:hypothetical protein